MFMHYLKLPSACVALMLCAGCSHSGIGGENDPASKVSAPIANEITVRPTTDGEIVDMLFARWETESHMKSFDFKLDKGADYQALVIVKSFDLQTKMRDVHETIGYHIPNAPATASLVFAVPFGRGSPLKKFEFIIRPLRGPKFSTSSEALTYLREGDPMGGGLYEDFDLKKNQGAPLPNLGFVHRFIVFDSLTLKRAGRRESVAPPNLLKTQGRRIQIECVIAKDRMTDESIKHIVAEVTKDWERTTQPQRGELSQPGVQPRVSEPKSTVP